MRVYKRVIGLHIPLNASQHLLIQIHKFYSMTIRNELSGAIWDIEICRVEEG